MLEELDVLEGPGDAQLGDLVRAQPGQVVGGTVPVHKADLALLRMVEAADAVEQAGLAGAVGSDDGEDFPVSHVQTDAAQGSHATEVQADVFNQETTYLFAQWNPPASHPASLIGVGMLLSGSILRRGR